MKYEYCRIDLSKTSYCKCDNWSYITDPNIDELNEIYKKYCQYKRFASVMPIFDIQYTNPNVDILGYHNEESSLVAFSLVMKYDSHNAECLQFAWDYAQPNLRLGIKSLKNECAVYKQRGYQYLYLGGVDKYKKELDGFEIIGTL